ncbi:hypothetical protein BH10BAC5_BH10BAC5_00980 [soil metagenome]
MLKYLGLLIVFISAAVIYSCSNPVSNPTENKPPVAHLSIFPDSIIAPGTTLKRIHWWGDDPDGFVVGFRISFDSVNWGYTTNNDSTFVLNINGTDSTFRFFVQAVDNYGALSLPASNYYPVINSPPFMTFNANTNLPDTTFPIATVVWSGSDPDGNSTLTSYYYSLNDTLHYKRIPGNINSMTLTKDSGLVLNSNNKIYMKAQDNAGSFSPVVSLPDSANHWYVKKVNAKILMIRDVPSPDLSAAVNFYNAAFDTLKYDVLDIKSYGGALIPKVINPMFIETLKLYNYVIWTSGSGSGNAANFDLAQNSLPFYLQSGRKLLFTSGFSSSNISSQGNLINFAPVDSITTCAIPFMLMSENFIVTEPSYPQLKPSITLSSIKGLKISGNTVPIYKLALNRGCFDTITVMMKDVQVNPKVIYLTIPLYYMNGDPAAAKAFIRKVFINEFGYN